MVMLSLGVLWGFAGLVQAVFLSFRHPRISGQVSRSLQAGPQFTVGLDQRPGDAQADSPGLAGHPATAYSADDVKSARLLRQFHRLQDNQPIGPVGKEILKTPVIDGYISAAG